MHRAQQLVRQLSAAPRKLPKLHRTLAARRSFSYSDEFKASISEPARFWAEKARQRAWLEQPPQNQILTQDVNGIDRWFSGGKLNQSYLALDHHVKTGRGQQTALIFDSPVTGTKAFYTYSQLRDEVARLAGLLRNKFNVQKGDRER